MRANKHPLDTSYKKLLECLFEKGLSPKTESVIEGFAKFFRNSYMDTSELLMAKSIGNALVESLTSPEYKIVEVAAIVLRDYVNSVYEMPPNCIQKLVEALRKTVPSSAFQAGLTLGCLGCTKPFRRLQPPSIRPIDDVDRMLCWQCGGGFMRSENAEHIVSSLIDNLSRPISRDRSHKVRRACAIALGEIGYTNPKAVLDALNPLREILKEGDGRDAAIFALGCVGYTRPDLVEDLVPLFQRVCSKGDADPFAWLASFYALKKIGMETKCLLDYTLKGKKKLDETMNIFFERMKEYEGGLVDESIDAIKELAEKFPDEVIKRLNQKLDNVHREPKGTGSLVQNLSITIDELAEKFPEKMRETVPLLLEHFKKKGYGYRTLDSSAIALKKIFQRHPEFIPEDITEILTQFLKDEERASVIQNTSQLLEEIEKHK